MTIDAKEKHRTDRPGANGSGSVWFGDERRRLLRVEVDEAAYVSSGGASTRCRVLNISAEGAAIDVPKRGLHSAAFSIDDRKRPPHPQMSRRLDTAEQDWRRVRDRKRD
jgi:hypothetical protein